MDSSTMTACSNDYSYKYLFSRMLQALGNKNDILIHKKNTEPWKVTLVDTGEDVMTGGRLKRVKDYLKNEEMFCFTYGDGLSNVNIKNLIKFHIKNKSLAPVPKKYRRFLCIQKLLALRQKILHLSIPYFQLVFLQIFQLSYFLD